MCGLKQANVATGNRYTREPPFETAKITNMKFAALIEYTPDKAKIAATRPEHRDYLKNVLESGVATGGICALVMNWFLPERN